MGQARGMLADGELRRRGDWRGGQGRGSVGRSVKGEGRREGGTAGKGKTGMGWGTEQKEQNRMGAEGMRWDGDGSGMQPAIEGAETISGWMDGWIVEGDIKKGRERGTNRVRDREKREGWAYSACQVVLPA